MPSTATPIDTTVNRILRVATVKSLLASELGDKLRVKYPGEYADNRSFGRALGRAVEEGKLLKSGSASRPKYAKPKS